MQVNQWQIWDWDPSLLIPIVLLERGHWSPAGLGMNSNV